jgi:hypothetical protein
MDGLQMYRMLTPLVLAFCCTATVAADIPFARLDLRSYGYQFVGPTSVFADYTDLGFLSEDLVLISINQRSFGRVEPTFADTPSSTVVVFDIKRGSVLTTGKMAVEKLPGSVQVVKGERFAVLNEKGLRFCDVALQCGPPIETKGPMFVSPQGKWVAVGGNALSTKKVIETESLKQVAVFDSGNIFDYVIPGDGATLVNKWDRGTIQRPGHQDAILNIDSRGNSQESRFLNSELLACLDWAASEAVVTDMEAKQIWRYKVAKAWRSGFLTATSGTRFAIHEYGYTLLNSIINFLDIDDGRPEDFQRVRVIDITSGREVFQLEWDPRPHLIKPALSPSGHRVARVKGGILEVFQVN